MSETLIGVIIGGLIGIIAPIITLILTHIHWGKEKKLEYLKSKRSKYESLFKKALKDILDGMPNDNISMETVTEIWALMPKTVAKIFDDFMLDEEKTPEKGKKFYLEISIAMKESLAEIDKKIEDLVS